MQRLADTHAVLWYIYASPELSERAKLFIEHSADNGLAIGVSTISLAEMVYLIEKRRIAHDAYIRLKEQLDNPENVLTELHVTSQVVEAMSLVPYADVPDFPDRIIAATAKSLGVPVITRDRKIRMADLESIW